MRSPWRGPAPADRFALTNGIHPRCCTWRNTRSASATVSRTRPGRNCGPACWPPNRAPRSSRSGTSRTASTRPSAPSRAASAPAADAAVRELGWTKPYHVDADHIRLETVDGFLASSRLLHHRRGRRRSASPPTPDAVKAFADRHPELVGRLEIPGIERAVHDDAGRRGADRRQVPARRAGGGRDLSPHRRRQGRGPLHHRSLDGRDRQPADAARVAGDPGGHRRRGDPDPDDRAEVHRPLQQGRGLRRRPRAVREGVPARTWRSSPSPSASTGCRRT